MPTPAAALKLMREIVASLPDTSEGAHYGKASFKVGRKMFATFGDEKIGDGKIGCGMIVGLEPDHCKLLLASDTRFAPFREYPNCVFLAAAEMKNRDEVRDLVAESYRIVAGGAAGKKPAALPRKKAAKKRLVAKRAKKK